MNITKEDMIEAFSTNRVVLQNYEQPDWVYDESLYNLRKYNHLCELVEKLVAGEKRFIVYKIEDAPQDIAKFCLNYLELENDDIQWLATCPRNYYYENDVRWIDVQSFDYEKHTFEFDGNLVIVFGFTK